jgi:hypothetical protein
VPHSLCLTQPQPAAGLQANWRASVERAVSSVRTFRDTMSPQRFALWLSARMDSDGYVGADTQLSLLGGNAHDAAFAHVGMVASQARNAVELEERPGVRPGSRLPLASSGTTGSAATAQDAARADRYATVISRAEQERRSERAAQDDAYAVAVAVDEAAQAEVAREASSDYLQPVDVAAVRAARVARLTGSADAGLGNGQTNSAGPSGVGDSGVGFFARPRQCGRGCLEDCPQCGEGAPVTQADLDRAASLSANRGPTTSGVYAAVPPPPSSTSITSTSSADDHERWLAQRAAASLGGLQVGAPAGEPETQPDADGRPASD